MLGNTYNFVYFDLIEGWIETHSVNDPYRSLSYRERKHERNLQYKRWRPNKEKREIAILLDVQGTLDGINDETCTLFINQIDFIRRYFKAGKARIVLSSYMPSPTPMKPFIETLMKHIKPNIIIDDAYYRHGTYNYEKDEENEIWIDGNFNKIQSFEEKYLKRRDRKQTVWFAIFDDGLSENLYKKYCDNTPSFFCKPSLICELDKKYDNFMSRSTITNGFDGVVESFGSYITDLGTIRMSNSCSRAYEIVLECQKNMLVHLSALEVKTMCIEKRFNLLLRYLKNDKIDEDDYQTIFFTLKSAYTKIEPTEQEFEKLKEILFYVKEHLKKENVVWSLLLEKK